MREKNSSDKSKPWYKLDNAGKIFPGQNSSKYSNIFRFAVVLHAQVNPALLQTALEQTLVRFPCFHVRMRRGVFWYYLEHNSHPAPPVLEDVNNPCTRVKWNENLGFLFRVYYYDKRIAVEFFHALTDAFGATRFLMTLTACYLRLNGAAIPPGESVLDLEQPPDPQEMEDAFLRCATSGVKLSRKKSFVYHAKGTRLPPHTMHALTGYLPVEKLKQEAARYGATITEYLAAQLLDILYRKQLAEEKKQKEVSVQIPVNLRGFFPSKTLRNFSLTYNARINPNMGEYSFAEILKQVSLYLRYVNNEKELNAMMAANLGIESNPFTRAIPLPLKNLSIFLVFLLTGEKTTSVLFSNLGIVKVPQEMEPYLERMLLMTGPGLRNTARFACVSYNGTLAISLASIFEQTDIERELFTRLVKLGIPVQVESNIQ